MPEVCDIAIVVEYIKRHFSGKKVTSVRCGDGWEEMERLIGHSIASLSFHGKEMSFRWEDEEGGEVWMTVHLMLQGRLYDEQHCQDQGHYFTLLFDEEGEHKCLTMYDHMAVATCTLSDEEPDAPSGVCVMSGVVTDSDLSSLYGRGAIYTSLLKQGNLAGIGSQLATEILYRARIHPARLGISLSPSERETLLSAINTVPSLVRNCGGFHHTRPVCPNGENGHYVPCYSNEGEVRKVKVAGKATWTREAEPQ